MGWHWHQLDHMQIICTSLQSRQIAMPVAHHSTWRQERVAEIDNSWKSYTCFSADYVKKSGRICGAVQCLRQWTLNPVTHASIITTYIYASRQQYTANAGQWVAVTQKNQLDPHTSGGGELWNVGSYNALRHFYLGHFWRGTVFTASCLDNSKFWKWSRIYSGYDITLYLRIVS